MSPAQDSTHQQEPYPFGRLFLSVPEAATLIGVKAQSLRKRIKAGKLRAFGTPFRILVLLSDVAPSRPVSTQIPGHRVQGLNRGYRRPSPPPDEDSQ